MAEEKVHEDIRVVPEENDAPLDFRDDRDTAVPILGIQALIDRAIAEKRKDREESPKDAWRSSGLGSCLVTRYLERKGVPADEDFDARTLRVFSVGTLMEDWLVDLIKSQPEVSCEMQTELMNEEYNLRGHLDLKLKKGGEAKIIDCKSKQSKAFWYMDKKGEGANKHHMMQVWSYLWMDGKTDKGAVVYLSKDDLCVLEYPVFLSDERLKQAVINELIVLNEAWKQGLPPPPVRWSFETKQFVPLGLKDWQFTYSRWQKQILTQPKYLDISNLKLI